MSRWFRHYAGLARDEKLVRVALASKQPIERVVWIWIAILESAGEIDDNGRYSIDSGEVAYFLRADQTDIDTILAILETAGHVSRGCVVKWSGRQFKSDNSIDRVKRHRDGKREAAHVSIPGRNGTGERGDGNGNDGAAIDVTAVKRFGNAPEAETETYTETEAAPQLSRGDLDRIESECRSAAGLENDPSPSLLDISPINKLLQSGYDLSGDILPKLREAKARGKRGKSWKYYVPLIVAARADNAQIPRNPASIPASTAVAWITMDDPRWQSLAERYRREKGHGPPHTAGLNGSGWHFPSEWIEDRAA